MKIGKIDVVEGGSFDGRFDDGGGNEPANLPHESEITVIEYVFVLQKLGIVFGDPIAQIFVEETQFALFAQQRRRIVRAIGVGGGF